MKKFLSTLAIVTMLLTSITTATAADFYDQTPAETQIIFSINLGELSEDLYDTVANTVLEGLPFYIQEEAFVSYIGEKLKEKTLYFGVIETGEFEYAESFIAINSDETEYEYIKTTFFPELTAEDNGETTDSTDETDDSTQTTDSSRTTASTNETGDDAADTTDDETTADTDDDTADSDTTDSSSETNNSETDDAITFDDEIVTTDYINIASSVISYSDGYIIIAESEEVLDTIEASETSLGEKIDFTNIKDGISGNNIFEFYLNTPAIESLQEGISYLFPDFYSDIMSLITMEGFSIAQTETGFVLKEKIIMNEEAMLESGLDFENIELELFEYMPKENVMLFSNEESINSQLIKNMIASEMAYASNEEKEILETIIKALGNETALLVQNTGTYLPEFTFMSQPSEENLTDLASKIDLADAAIWTAMTSEPHTRVINGNKIIGIENNSKTTIEKSEIELSGKKVRQYTISIQPKTSSNPYLRSNNNIKFDFTITAGLTGDNVFIFSTNSDIENAYKEDISNNDTIKELLNKPDVSAIGYVNPQEITTYLNSALTNLEKLNPENLDTSFIQENITAFFAPWGETTVFATQSTSEAYGEMSINLDMTQLLQTYSSEFFDNFDDSIIRQEDGFEGIFDSFKQEDIRDINPSQWYADDIYYLSANGIINGYADGNFYPERLVTRAEFVKMIITALQSENLVSQYPTYESDVVFDDVPYYEWFSNHVQIAVEHGFINGYSDQTFRPSNTITRAETAQIMSNILSEYALQNANPRTELASFTDTTDAWYSTAVANVYRNQIMQGVDATTFAADQELNRAEAATIIRSLLRIIETTKANGISDEVAIESHNGLVDNMDIILDAEDTFYTAYYELEEGESVDTIVETLATFKTSIQDLDTYMTATTFSLEQGVFVRQYNNEYKVQIDKYIEAADAFVNKIVADGYTFESTSELIDQVDLYGDIFVEQHNTFIDLINEQSDY